MTAFLPAVAALMFLAAGCGPSAYLLDVEMRRPSASGVDLIGKTVSVAYLDSGSETDSLFASAMSSAFISSLESDYFSSDSLITLYRVGKQPGVDYSDKDIMLGLLMDTGSDVVFLFDSPAFGEGKIARSRNAETGSGTATGEFPFAVNLYVYDSMDPRDTVLQFSGSAVADVSADVGDTVSDEGVEYILKSRLENTAVKAGADSGDKFSPRWSTEQIVFFIYDSAPWYDTYYYVNDYQWKKAMDIWISMLGTENMEKKACLEYNLAAACYILGQHSLASEWLALSQKHFHLSPYTDSLEMKLKKAGL